VPYAATNFVIPVPHVGQLARNIGLPFFAVSLRVCASSTSFFARHFTQYIVVIIIHLLSLVNSNEFRNVITHTSKIKDNFKRKYDRYDHERLFKVSQEI
jgi:hypothetical protein